jgi:hypothetical protein
MANAPDEIDLCVSALMGLKVARQAYASSKPYHDVKDALADALALNDSPLCKAVAEAIRGFLGQQDILSSPNILK